MKHELKLVWLYPEEMSTYGDRGNILTLQKRCGWRDIDLEVVKVGIGQTLPAEGSDFYFFGGGQDQAQIRVAEDLKGGKREFLQKEADQNKIFLGVCGGYQLLGHFYQDSEGKRLEGLGVLDVTTYAGSKRLIGNLVVETNFLSEKLVGFENHSGKTRLGGKANALGKVLVGGGNNGNDHLEGAFERNVYGCYLHGPVLPKNPHFADYLIKLALRNKYGDVELKFINDNQEHLAHESAVARAFKTK